MTMKDYQASLEKLRKDAAEAALIRDLATDKTKREMYRLVAEDVELWRTPAGTEKISQSEFLRQAIRKRANHCLKAEKQ